MFMWALGPKRAISSAFSEYIGKAATLASLEPLGLTWNQAQKTKLIDVPNACEPVHINMEGVS